MGIAGRTALVCGSSEGLGKACALALSKCGVTIAINGRDIEKLEGTAQEIEKETGGKVILAPGDVTNDEGRAAILEKCSTPDILVNNAGGPPPGDFRVWDEETWLNAIRGNMLYAVFMTNLVLDPMIERRWGRIINITSQAVKMPMPLIGLSTSARAGLTGYMGTISREIAQYGITVNNLLPGFFHTKRLQQYLESVAASRNVTAKDVESERAAANPSRRSGNPDEFGAWCAFIASDHSGYMTGQNILLDGGSYPGVM
ncbi:MAG: 3-oxoacyl-ACP reductase [Candidatus Marinimicrobia bacterium]|nr:3-oxoacyl-ACP reductase [Candidatus Neomarinimicrobiota bacterium]